MKFTLKTLFICLFVAVSAMAQNTKNVQIIELNTQTFKQKVWDFEKNKTIFRVGSLPIILDFHATWCGPCKRLAPHLQAIQNKYKGKLLVYKIDVDQEPSLAELFKVTAMPTIIFINRKTSFKSELGYKEYDEFETLVKAYFFSK
jgi:thioredoxin